MTEVVTGTMDDDVDSHEVPEVVLSPAQIRLARFFTSLADASSGSTLNFLLSGPEKYVEIVLGGLFGAVHGDTSNKIIEHLRANEKLKSRIWFLLRAANINMQVTMLEVMNTLSAQDILTIFSSTPVGLGPESFAEQIISTALTIHRVLGWISFITLVGVPTGIEAYKTYRVSKEMANGVASAFAGIRAAFVGRSQ